jgi:hypothetical protein
MPGSLSMARVCAAMSRPSRMLNAPVCTTPHRLHAHIHRPCVATPPAVERRLYQPGDRHIIGVQDRRIHKHHTGDTTRIAAQDHHPLWYVVQRLLTHCRVDGGGGGMCASCSNLVCAARHTPWRDTVMSRTQCVCGGFVHAILLILCAQWGCAHEASTIGLFSVHFADNATRRSTRWAVVPFRMYTCAQSAV